VSIVEVGTDDFDSCAGDLNLRAFVYQEHRTDTAICLADRFWGFVVVIAQTGEYAPGKCGEGVECPAHGIGIALGFHGHQITSDEYEIRLCGYGSGADLPKSGHGHEWAQVRVGDLYDSE